MSTPGSSYDGVGANEGDSPIDVPLAVLADADNPEYRLTGLSNTPTYYFVVSAYDDYARESTASNEVSISFTVNADDGAGGGCFIATAAFGSKMEKHAHALIILSGLAVLTLPLAFVLGKRHRIHGQRAQRKARREKGQRSDDGGRR